MKIQELKSFSETDLSDMDVLMHQLSETSYCNEKILQAIMDDENSHLYVVHTLEFILGFVESVTVRDECRGQHLGRKLMEHLMAEANRLGVQSLHLTSNLKRVAANRLYRAMGFERYETNVYKKEIS